MTGSDKAAEELSEKETGRASRQEREAVRNAKRERHRHNEKELGKRLLDTKELLWWLQANQLTVKIDELDPVDAPDRGCVRVQLRKDDVSVAEAQADYLRGEDYTRQAALGVSIGRARSSWLRSRHDQPA